jgi:hypothetical protein
MIANFKKETKVEIDYKIELPYFCKSITSYYKIIDEQTAIKVEYWDAQYYSIAVVSASIALNCGDQQCNSEDFYLALQQVNSYINHKANE